MKGKKIIANVFCCALISAIQSANANDKPPWRVYGMACGNHLITSGPWLENSLDSWNEKLVLNRESLKRLGSECLREKDRLNGDSGKQFIESFQEVSAKSASLSQEAARYDSFIDTEVLRITEIEAPVGLNFLEFACGKSFLTLKGDLHKKMAEHRNEFSDLTKVCHLNPLVLAGGKSEATQQRAKVGRENQNIAGLKSSQITGNTDATEMAAKPDFVDSAKVAPLAGTAKSGASTITSKIGVNVGVAEPAQSSESKSFDREYENAVQFDHFSRSPAAFATEEGHAGDEPESQKSLARGYENVQSRISTADFGSELLAPDKYVAGESDHNLEDTIFKRISREIQRCEKRNFHCL